MKTNATFMGFDSEKMRQTLRGNATANNFCPGSQSIFSIKTRSFSLQANINFVHKFENNDATLKNFTIDLF